MHPTEALTTSDTDPARRSRSAVDAEQAARDWLAADEWEARLRERVAGTMRRRAGRAAEREAKARRRAHGLVDRQAARLAEARRRATAAAGPPRKM